MTLCISVVMSAYWKATAFHIEKEPHWKGMVMWVGSQSLLPVLRNQGQGTLVPVSYPHLPTLHPVPLVTVEAFCSRILCQWPIKSKSPDSTSLYPISMSSSDDQCSYCSAKAAFIPIVIGMRHTLTFPSIDCLAGFGQISFFFKK